jgi:hypothetical protein
VTPAPGDEQESRRGGVISIIILAGALGCLIAGLMLMGSPGTGGGQGRSYCEISATLGDC